MKKIRESDTYTLFNDDTDIAVANSILIIQSLCLSENLFKNMNKQPIKKINPKSP